MTDTKDYDQTHETIEFYKIKLMQKEREISDHASKLKKIQFKNSRDVKQLKIAEEKAKLQLKQQKQKCDKLAKTATEATQQNTILQHRLTQLKQEKDKEIESVRAQYNHLKTQVRSYERILPTHTFMSKLGANYDQLPPYQEVFMNWKDKSERYDEIQQKLKTYQTEAEQKIKMLQNVQQGWQKKKIQLQKQLRDDMTKLLDLETQITTLAIQRDQLRVRLAETSEELNSANQTIEQMTDDNKNLESKLQEFARDYQIQIQAKEQQIQKITEEQFKKYEQQIERITKTYQTKENSHLQQLASFEEEEHKLYEKIQKDKQKFEETYKQMYNQVQKIKQELENEKQESWKQKNQYQKIKQELNKKDSQILQYLTKLGQYQLKISQNEIEIKKYEANISSQKDLNSEQNNEKKMLQQKILDLEAQANQLRECIITKQNQIYVLSNQIDELRSKANQTSAKKEFPSTNFYNDEVLRNRSGTIDNLQFQKIGPIKQITINHKNEETNKQIRSRQQSLISQQSVRRRASTMLYSQQQLEAKILQTIKQKQSEFEARLIAKVEEEINQKQKQLKSHYEQILQTVKMQYKKQLNETKKKSQQMQNKLKRINQENERQKIEFSESISKANKKYELLKLEKDNLQQSYIAHVNESKRDKEGLNIFKSQNRQLQKTLKEYHRNLQNITGQLDSLKKYKQKIEQKQNKQKSVSSETSTASVKQMMQKFTAQINKLSEQKQENIKLYHIKQEEVNTLKKQIQVKIRQIQKLNQDIDEKNRENQMLQDLLDHERKDRTLRTVPSLASLPDQDGHQQENFKQFYNQAGQKQGTIIMLEREVSDLKGQIDQMKQKNEQRMTDLTQQMDTYIQQIIAMKIRVAEAEMKASQKTHLYNQLKKKSNIK